MLHITMVMCWRVCFYSCGLAVGMGCLLSEPIVTSVIYLFIYSTLQLLNQLSCPWCCNILRWPKVTDLMNSCWQCVGLSEKWFQRVFVCIIWYVNMMVWNPANIQKFCQAAHSSEVQGLWIQTSHKINEDINDALLLFNRCLLNCTQSINKYINMDRNENKKNGSTEKKI